MNNKKRKSMLRTRLLGLLLIGLAVSSSSGCLGADNGTSQKAIESEERGSESFQSDSIENSGQKSGVFESDTVFTEEDEQTYSEAVNNHFTVNYGDSIFYMDNTGIHRLFSDGNDELYYPVEIESVNLFCYQDRLYYYDSDSKIHSVGIENKDETIIGDGEVVCDFYKDYLFTYMPGDPTEGREYAGYKINPKTGKRVDNKTYTIADISEIDNVSSVIMSNYSKISYKDENLQIYPQKINVLNPLISLEKFDGIYCYDIDDKGKVSLEFESEAENKEVVFWEKDMEYILSNDLNPIWYSLAVDSGIFYTDISYNAENVFPIYYSDTDGNCSVLVQKEGSAAGMIMNFDGEWLYYTASESSKEAVAACYRVNIHTLENECLYTSGSAGLLHQMNTMDIQNDLLFYYDTAEGKVNIMELNE